MFSRRKGLTYGLILAGALGLLTPQALVHLREEQSQRRELLEVSNFDSASASAAAPARVIDPSRSERPDASDVVATRAAQPEGPGTAGGGRPERHSERYRPSTYVGASSPAESQRRLDELEHSLQQIQNFVPSKRANELESMAAAWNLKSGDPDPGAGDGLDGGDLAEEPPSEADRPIVFETLRKPSEGLLAYLETNSLLGTLVAGEDSAALLGGRILRVGSSLPDDLGTVVAIERQAVTIAVGEIEVRVELPPLREARRTPDVEGGDVEGQDGEPEAAQARAAPAQAGAAEPTVPATQPATDTAAQRSGQEGGGHVQNP